MAFIDDAVRSDLSQQLALIATWVAETGLDANEPREFQEAWRVLESLGVRLPIVRDLGRLGAPSSRNIVRRVALTSGKIGVLKVYGRPEPGEIEVLRLWAGEGIPCPAIVAAGQDGAGFVLMLEVPGKPLAQVAPTRQARARHTGAAVATFASAHVSAAQVTALGTVGDNVFPNLLWAASTSLPTNGFSVHPRWQSVFRALTAQNPVVVHGDPAAGNLIVTPQDTLCLIDPSGCVGPREFDAARWIARLHLPDMTDALIETACHVDPSLDPSLLRGWLGLEFLLEAGVCLIPTTPRNTLLDPVLARSDAAARQAEAAPLHAAAEHFLHQFRLPTRSGTNRPQIADRAI